MLGNFEAADEVVTSTQIEWFGKVDGSKILTRDQQRLLAHIGAVHPLRNLDPGILPLAQPGSSAASNVEHGTYAKKRREKCAEPLRRADRAPFDILKEF